MAKLEQDNKILAELDCKLQNVTAIDSTEKPQNYSMSSSLPSLTSSNLFQSSVLTDSGVGSAASALSKPSFHKLAQNGTQQINTIQNQRDLEELRFDKFENSSIYNIQLSNRANVSKTKPRIDSTPYNYDPIFKYSSNANAGAFIDKSLYPFNNIFFR
jgi:hypothetical protein